MFQPNAFRINFCWKNTEPFHFQNIEMSLLNTHRRHDLSPENKIGCAAEPPLVMNCMMLLTW